MTVGTKTRRFDRAMGAVMGEYVMYHIALFLAGGNI